MKDIRLIIKLKNNRLVKAREKLGFNQSQMARYCGMGETLYCDLENLKVYPILKNGDWNAQAVKISSMLGIREEELFPQAFEKIQNTKLNYEIGLNQVAHIDRLQLAGPMEEIEKQNLKEKIKTVLSSLTPREQLIIKAVYEDERTHESIGEELKITSSRVRQIECKALRKLRHPSRSNLIRDFHYEEQNGT